MKAAVNGQLCLSPPGKGKTERFKGVERSSERILLIMLPLDPISHSQSLNLVVL